MWIRCLKLESGTRPDFVQFCQLDHLFGRYERVMTGLHSGTFVFADFVLDLDAAELRQGGRKAQESRGGLRRYEEG